MSEAAAGPALPTRVRHLVLGSLAALTVHAYLTRVCLAPAASTIQADLRLSNASMGWVLGAFAMGYWAQVPGGWLGARLGARWGLSLACLVWSLATIATALAGSAGLLWWSRLAVGLGQAVLFPVANAAVSSWYPRARRGSASSVITSFMSVGGVLGSGLTIRLMGPLGWRPAFLIFGIAGVIASAVFAAWYRNLPGEHPAVNDAERALILDGVAPAPEEPSEPMAAVFLQMLRSPTMGALCLQHFFRSFGYFFFVTWFPTFLERGYGVSRERAGELNMLPLAGVVAGSFAGGWAVDRVYRLTGKLWASRSGVAAGSLLLCALATACAAMAPAGGTVWVVALVTLGTFFSGFSGPATWATAIDVGGKSTPLVFAVMNTLGNLGSVLCPIIVGYQIDSITRSGGSWTPILLLFSCVYLAAALSWLVLDPNRPVIGPARPAS
ncbi:MFS transporter [Isosphaeraceae bacterium EP7]